ncbi:cyanogenic beta-glucosidase [Spatholobus suberectus]|nr:cyanogenic beta-glucosidase [Spatholobus suberectus]
MENSVSSGGTSFNSSNVIDANEFCNCGIPCKLQTSWTERNPGRRFYGCGRYGLSSHCDYFSWFDPPTTSQARRVIDDLMNKNKELMEEMVAQKAALLILQEKVKTQKEDLMVLKRELVEFKAHIKKLRIVIGCMVILITASWFQMF